MDTTEAARAHKAAGRHTQAAELYRQALGPGATPGLIAEALPSVQRSDPAEAERLARRALLLVPGHPVLEHHLAEALARQGAFEAAVPRFRSAVAASGALAELHGGGAPWTTRDPELPCASCGAREGHPVWVGNASATQRHLGLIDPVKIWLRCSGCGLVRVPNPAPAHRLDAWYERTYSGGETHAPPQGQALHQLLQHHEATLARLARVRGAEGGRMLEIGAAWGVFLASARWHGFEVQGLELAAPAVVWGRAHLGVDLQRGRVPEDLPDGMWDVIVMMEVVEHVPDPDALLRALAGRLSPGGSFVLSTPFLDHPYHQASGYDDPMWGVPGHLVYFDRVTLAQSLACAGLRIVEMWSSPLHLGSGIVIASAVTR